MQTRNSNIRRTRVDNVLAVKKTNTLLDSNHLSAKLRVKDTQLTGTFHKSAVPKQISLYKDFCLEDAYLGAYKQARKQRNDIRSVISEKNLQLAGELFDRTDSGEYQEENFNWLQERELHSYPLKSNFINTEMHEITPRMRYILVNWLVEVHQSYKLTPESLFLTIALLDRFIQYSKVPLKKEKFQLVGIASLYTAAKFEEIFPPDIQDFVTISDNAVSKNDIKQCERELLKMLEFRINIPPPILFLRRLTSAINADQICHNLSKYILELTVQEYELAHLSGNTRAAISVCLARALCEDVEDLNQVWTDELIYLSGLRCEDIKDDLRILARAAYRQNSPSRYRAIHTKYASNEALGLVADLPILRSVLLERIADLKFENQ